MSPRETTQPIDAVRVATVAAYEAPAVRELGTLADLTLGGDAAGTPDGFGQSGDSGFTGSIS